MEKFFTPKYKEITEIYNLKLEVEDRWICCMQKETLGVKGELVTLTDNYGERYYVKKDLNTNTITVDKGLIQYGYIYLKTTPFMSSPFPDFAIDVLQTMNVQIGIETLCRVAETFKRKYR
jgi:hypothetical protein